MFDSKEEELREATNDSFWKTMTHIKKSVGKGQEF